ncbi:hypothetical protein E2320_009043 [Naja naja]|nr:hypothetical protein E2320_009043 [Naja naja]
MQQEVLHLSSLTNRWRGGKFCGGHRVDPGWDTRRSPKGGPPLPDAEEGETHLTCPPILVVVREPACSAGGSKERPPQGICRWGTLTWEPHAICDQR